MIQRTALLLAAATIGAAACGFAQPARAQSDAPLTGQPATPETSDLPSQQATVPSIASSLPNPDPGGVRVALGSLGITYSLTYIGEGMGSLSGGIRRGSAYNGRLDAQLDADLEKLAGLPGLAFHANAYQLHGRGLSACCLGNILTSSGIEAKPATRLFELWLEQTLLGGKLAIRAGQLAADSEFLVSQYAGLFVNATFGWPAAAGANLPSGGPAFPLATPGVRLKVSPNDSLAALLAVFNGDPAGPGLDDPQRRNRSGTNFRLRDSPFVIGEVSYSYHQDRTGPGLPGTVKLGGYHHFGRFDDARTGADGLSLADPDSGGSARRLRGNSGVYGVLDQLVYREPGTVDQGLGVFFRLSASPSDRNLIGFYADAGITYKGLLPGRVNDTLGVGVSYARIASSARALDRDAASVAGTPIRSSEMLLELTYQAAIVPGFTIQPDIQYIVRPGGHVANGRDPGGAAVKNAALVGVRATIRY